MKYEHEEILRFKNIKNILKVSRSSIDRWEKAGCFPKRVVLGKNSVGWYSKDVMHWINSRKFR